MGQIVKIEFGKNVNTNFCPFLVNFFTSVLLENYFVSVYKIIPAHNLENTI